MTRFAAGVVLALGFAGLGRGDDAAPKGLDGAYKALALVRDGKDAPAEVVAATTMKVAGDELTITVKDKIFPAKIKLDAAKKPAHVDVSPSDGPDKGRTFPGIYKIEKGELVLSFAETGDRPTEFKGEDAQTLLRFKRDDKAK